MEPVQNNENSFSAVNQRFALADNMDNISKIERMWRAQWPEFSWLTVPGKPESRCYQMFAPDISRVGYGAPDPTHNNDCRVWSVICPQQGVWIEPIQATLNIEVTVTSSGGWLSEGPPMNIDAQITIQPKLWFSPSTMTANSLIQKLYQLFINSGIPFPFSKANAIKLDAFGVDQKDQPVKSRVLDIKTGIDPNYKVPDFAQHKVPNEYNMVAASVAYLAVEIGEVLTSGNPIADWFNQFIMAIFNLASGNLLLYKNILSWNVWVIAPEQVYTPEWQMHADYWRFSLDVNHRSPEGNGRDPKYFDGTPFNSQKAAICGVLKTLQTELAKWEYLSPTLVKDIEALLAVIIAGNCGDSDEVVFL